MTKSLRQWPPCGTSSCVDIEDMATDRQGNDLGFRFTSTIPGNHGAVGYTPAEVAQFLNDVKAGRWDHVIAKAEARAAAELSAV